MNLFISFSGGETSAVMTRLLLTEWRDRYEDVVVVFANTGQENEATLEFIRACDEAFGFQTVWVEAVVNSAARAGTTHKIVDFATASRDGQPYEDVIKKFGLPNTKFPHCTRELKQRPMQSYIRSLGWAPDTFHTAIGIRADEARRRSPNAEVAGLVYPLLDWRPTTKPEVNTWWWKQSFRLRLAGYQGNCKWCWKKSFRELLTLMDENPRQFDFPERMEAQYGLVGAEFKKTVSEGYRRVFFRGGVSTQDLRELHAKGGFDLADDDSIVLAGEEQALDVEPSDGSGCTESCEVDWSQGVFG